jgi:glycosyltransferase involved in cell wall biosynthesis
MDIIILEDSSKAGFGGGQKITLDVINSLKNFHNLHVFDTKTNSTFSNELKNINITPKKLYFSNDIKYNISMLFIPFFLLLNFILLKKYISNKLYEKKYLVYATTKNGLFLAYLMNIILGSDFVYHAHLIESNFKKKIVTFLTKNASKVICVSKMVSEQFKRNNLIIIPNSIDSIKINPKNINNKNNFIVASISTLNNIKGIEYYLDSHKYLLNKNIIYHVYGDGPLKDKIIKSSNKTILYMGHANNIKEILISKIDLLIVPSIISESFSMIMIEAFSCGVPVVTTNIGMQNEHIINSRAGQVFEIKSSSSIASTIDNILNNEKKYFTYSINAIKYSKLFDKSIFNQSIINVFDEI